ncbi:serpin family protein [Candidatus Aciduliprofundum boonei]|uniref:Proteinase inhibitor I4 serpin n=1 Tax=Aciduliprofundum boonei (strain DSM 19572 / T469) TaxID=439481 RepID=B5IEP5_ACIB4|nr:serpin family protein [Candidatus Aciduliprofundum boonei]ADD07919.1 proteinase inhibitor I4 serpin [Aciduliprofundum boonei T469]EDY35197.1 serine proteinase inhibitor [Aciduliprofundum boonei T469]HII55571.1 serpin family protein [Candidatus Aciduliprofundum boonei]
MKTRKVSSIITLILTALLLGTYIFQNAPTTQNSNKNLRPQWNNGGVNTENLQALGYANNRFALSLFNEIWGQENNTFFSPLSIWIVLAMLYEGAEGESAAQLEKVLYLPKNKTILQENIKYLLDELNNGGNYTLKIANALWPQINSSVKQEYAEVLENYYYAYLQYLNYAKDPEKAIETINSWVENQTNRKIKNLLHKGDVNPQTILVLTNAIYFYGLWNYPFNASKTNNGYFLTPHGRVKVKMMHGEFTLKYTEDKNAQVVELPYKGKNISMLVILPKTQDFEINLTKIQKWIENLRDARVNISFPRFDMKEKLNLKNSLERLGIKDIFNPAKANLSGISQSISVSNIVHQSYVKVDENGTEAAAATGVSVVATALPLLPHVVFNADHPFLFLIMDKITGSILFMGWVAYPS